MKYLYESHMGGLYTSDEYLDDDYLYCEECGDYDWLIGEFETLADFWNLVKDECDINGSGGYSLPYVYPIIVAEFELPYEVTYENDYMKDCGFCCNSSEEILRNIEDALKRGTETWDCETCMYYPPSSCDGKPCSVCDTSDPFLNCYSEREE